ncbi:MAG: regulatory protein RecX [Anaerovoracaceae bacterium]|jgi:regulatory protein|nr:regulatory protein RecX [Anaerovoracaceae bacterium]
MKGKELAIKYLSLRARSVWQMKKYLIEKGQNEEEVASIIQELVELGYLNDEAYARDYILYGRSKNRGQIRIAKELDNKGITREIIDSALGLVQAQEILEDGKTYSERVRAEELALSWVEGVKIDEKVLRKVAGKLASLGYEVDTIYGIVGVLMAKGNEDNGSDQG